LSIETKKRRDERVRERESSVEENANIDCALRRRKSRRCCQVLTPPRNLVRKGEIRLVPFYLMGPGLIAILGLKILLLDGQDSIKKFGGGKET